jgi:hypothetical protein
VSHFAGKFELGKKAASGIFDEVAILESTSMLQRRLIEIISREPHAKGELPIPELSFEGMRSNLRRRLYLGRGSKKREDLRNEKGPLPYSPPYNDPLLFPCTIV